ncbi:MAG: universal stress protein [Dehalococcoidia bacterium]
MIKKLLVPLDQSPLSEEALGVVKDLLGMGIQEVTLLTIADAPKPTRRRRTGLRAPLPISASATGPFVPSVIPASDPQYAESRDQAVERREHELLDYLAIAGGPLVKRKPVIHAAVHFGDPAKEIIAYAKREKVDMIVMATHGRSGLSRTLHGSVTSAVIGSGVAPVLVVRPKAVKKRTQPARRKTQA